MATVVFDIDSVNQLGNYTPWANGQPGATIRCEGGMVILPERPEDVKRTPAQLYATAVNLKNWNDSLQDFMTIPAFPAPMYSRDLVREEKKLNINLQMGGEDLLVAEGYLFEDTIVLLARKERKLTFREYLFLNLSQFFYLDQFALAKAK